VHHLPLSLVHAGRWKCRRARCYVRAVKKIPLTESEWSFASALKRHSPNKVDRRDLIRMMGYNSSFYERNRMDAMVRRLRHKILAITTTLNPIQTVHGIGYVWRE